MEKVMNFRDLGGIKTSDGRKVKKGLFFRSALLDEASEKDIEFLKSLGLKVIFDYRDESETKFFAEGGMDIYSRLNVKHALHPADLNNQKLFKLNNAKGFRKVFVKVGLSDVQNTYRSLPFNSTGYNAMMQALVNGEVPFLQHCSAGKDRAGMGSALLLAILGVPYENILEDYMISLQVRDYIANKVAGHIPKFVRSRLLKRYEPLFIVHETLLKTAVSAIMERYGTFENYLEKEYSLTPEMVAELRNRYTE